MKSQTNWTELEIEQLIMLKSQGLEIKEISKKLNRSKSAVQNKWFSIRTSDPAADKLSSSWSHEETELLIALSETLPRSILFARYNQVATSKGYQKRSLNSITLKINELGQSTAPQTGWYGTTAISIGLGFSRNRIEGWLKSGLKSHREGKNIYVRNDHLVEYILERPSCLDGITNDGLHWFLSLLQEEKEMRGRIGRPEYMRALDS